MAIPVPDTFLWLTEADVCRLVGLKDVIGGLEKGLRLEARGEAKNMAKAQLVWPGASLNVTGAQFTGDGLVGAKVWSNAHGGAAPIIIMHGSEDGQIRAIVEAFALGQMRSAALSCVSTKWLADEDADEMAIIGSGHQSLPQVSAVNAVRKLSHVRVYSPTAENRAKFVAQLKDTFDFKVTDCSSVEEAVKDVPIITTFTRAKEPFLFESMLAKGTHINAGGAIIPTNAEIAQDVIARCDKVVCDNLAQVQKSSKELKDYYTDGPGNWDDVIPICNLVKEQKPRPAGADLTIYKFMGMGMADLASATEIYRRAQAQGVGRQVPHPQRSKPRLT